MLQSGSREWNERLIMTGDPIIGTLQESSLHQQLKEIYADTSDTMEVPVDGYVIDIERNGQLIEIQTKRFYSIRKKLRTLVKDHRVLLVHPLVSEKWIVRETIDGRHQMGRRKSPKKQDFLHVFIELVSLPRLLENPNFSLELVLVKAEEVQRKDGKGSWKRKGWSVVDTRLLEVVDRIHFNNPKDLLILLPNSLPSAFTNADLARDLHIPRRLAEKVTYCMLKMGVLRQVGKKGRARLHAVMR